jgi:hypothetical protein
MFVMRSARASTRRSLRLSAVSYCVAMRLGDLDDAPRFVDVATEEHARGAVDAISGGDDMRRDQGAGAAPIAVVADGNAIKKFLRGTGTPPMTRVPPFHAAHVRTRTPGCTRYSRV